MSAFTPQDEQVLGVLATRSGEMRALLYTLARVGVAWRRREPERARAWLARLETHPFYKGGQVLFDLLEWEDFMLDGKPPEPDAQRVLALILRIAELLGLPPPTSITIGDLPVLEVGFYLYRDVLLGGIDLGMQSIPFDLLGNEPPRDSRGGSDIRIV